MTERRWDVVLRVVSGPTASREPVVLRGPVVTVGSEPGPGGLQLPAMRGIAARHCTISAYDPTSVHVTPVGDHEVRLAPYTDVAWEELEPVRERVRLARGNAIHVGPAGRRGVTLEFVECRDLGVQASARLASEASDAAVLAERPPDGIQAVQQRPSVRRLLAEGMPSDRFQRAVMVLLAGSGFLLLAALVTWMVRVTLPPAEPPAYFWSEIQVSDWDPATISHEGFDAPIHDFVVSWNRTYARGFEHPELVRDDPSAWDPALFGAVVASAKEWSRRPQLFKRFDEVRDAYAAVISELRAADMPEVLAAIPMVESCYKPEVWSPCCARGWWQFMPEFGPRFRDDPAFAGLGLDVATCARRDAPDVVYDLVDKAPPPRACETADYVNDGACNMSDCAVDFRTDLRLSTLVALRTLRSALEDPTLAASGAAVAIAIASHHAGYDDRPLYDGRDVNKPYNLLPAYERWWKERGSVVPTPHFFGDAARCLRTPGEGCQRYLTERTQRYVVMVMARHLMATCYYAENYPENTVFQRYAAYTGPGGFCEELDVPTAASVRDVRVGLACPR